MSKNKQADPPPYLRIAEAVNAHGRISTSKLVEMFSCGEHLLYGSEAPDGLAEAERCGLVRQDGEEPGKRPFTFDYYWVPGRNDLSLAVRSNQVARLRRETDASAATLIRDNIQVLRETFLEQGPFVKLLEEWIYQDGSVAYDEWLLKRDASALQKPVPPPSPPNPEKAKAVVPPKPKPWSRKD